MKKIALISWTLEIDDGFKKMRRLMAVDALAAYPDHNQIFDIYTDASDYQLGACIIQNGRPDAYFTKINEQVSYELHNNGKGTPFHSSNSERVQIYATRC